MIETLQFALKALMWGWRSKPEVADKPQLRLYSPWRSREWRLDAAIFTDALDGHIEDLQREADEYEGEDDADEAKREVELELRAATYARQLWALHQEQLANTMEQLNLIARGKIAREVEGRFPGSEIARDLRGE